MADRSDAAGPAAWSWVPSIAAREPADNRSSTAERVADVLRSGITEGHLPPGSRLSEQQLSAALGVSRNTLREAFRLLGHEGLLVHRLHAGVVVPELDEAGVVDLYRLRLVLEVQAVLGVDDVDAGDVERLHDDIADAEAAAREGRWTDVGTANLHFHQHLVGMAHSPRADDIARRLLAELRLAFHVAGEKELYELFLPRNRELVALLQEGDTTAAAGELQRYLQDSQAELLAAYRRHHAP
jgi:DNA-binding GntR family transcriptional regulator